MSPVEIVQLCEVDMLCAHNAAALVRLKYKGRTSRRIGVCAEYLPGLRERVAAEGCAIVEEPIKQAVPA